MEFEAQGSRYRRDVFSPVFLVALLLSVVLHFWLAGFIREGMFAGDSVQPRTVTPSSLQLRIRRPAPVALDPIVAAGERKHRRRLSTPKVVAGAPPKVVPDSARPAAPLELSGERVERILRELVEQEASAPTTGGTVVDRALARHLSRAPRRTGVAAEQRGAAQDNSFSAGSWVDQVRIGDSCFRVRRANPLEPLDHEMWYMAECE